MKKIIAYLLVAMMCLSSLAACANEKVNEDLQAAADYVYAMYKDAGSVTAKDFERTAQVMIGTTKYVVEWTTDNEAVKVTVADNIATIDVDEKSPEEVAYTLTATIKDADGNEVKKEFKYTVPKYEGLEKIVKDAYALQAGEALDGTYTLEGVITKVDTAYSESYKNVTVTIQVGNLTDMPIMCYRLKDGDGVSAAATIKVGDTITVSGTLKNYNGTIEFDAGCTLDKVVVGEGPVTPEPEVPTVPSGATMEQIVDIAYTLASGQQLTDKQTLAGVITKVDTEYSADYQNVTVTIQVGSKSDKLIMCFRMKGDGADTIKVGDTITVTGILKNYNGTIEFDAGCTLDKVVAGEGGSTQEPEKPDDKPADTTPTTPAEIMAAAEKLAENEYLGGSSDVKFQLSGVITEVVADSYSSQYGNMHFTMKVDGTEKTLYCYAVPCEETDQFKVGEKVTINGPIMNYKGTVEYSKPDLVSRDKSGAVADTPVSTAPDVNASAKEILTAAYALGEGESLGSQKYTLTGVIKSFKYTYSPDFDNIQCTIVCDGLEDMPIVCYKLKGEGIDKVQEGSTITVTGEIKNF
ncbi:MAG: hypothetical protein ACI4TK_13575, partial [Agathobacter sp.]